MNDIFDLKNTEDLPEKLYSSKDNKSSNLLELFDLKEILSVEEMQAGYFRKYGIFIKRNSMYSHLSGLMRRGLIKKVGIGVFEKIGGRHDQN